MSVCWFCYWGWPKPIYDIYTEALNELNEYESPLHYGPAHIVWEDENFDSAQWCLDNFDEYRREYTDDEMDIVRESLVKLLAIPGEYKSAPDGYDGENPEKFPPPPHWVMVK